MENKKRDSRKHLSFSKNDINQFIFSLRKGVYSHGYMDEWKKFTLLEKK